MSSRIRFWLSPRVVRINVDASFIIAGSVGCTDSRGGEKSNALAGDKIASIACSSRDANVRLSLPSLGWQFGDNDPNMI